MLTFLAYGLAAVILLATATFYIYDLLHMGRFGWKGKVGIGVAITVASLLIYFAP